jgi:hypothetical protein
MGSPGGQPFPLSKLLFMFLTRLAQPVGRRVLCRARTDPVFRSAVLSPSHPLSRNRNYVCLPPANLYHFYEAKIKFRLLNIGKVSLLHPYTGAQCSAVQYSAV